MQQILLIDDDDAVRGFITEILTTSGYAVSEAVSGEQGLELYKQSPSDLVITDLIMPGKDGIDLIMELREEFPHVKIIAISGGKTGDGKFYLEIAKSFGAQGMISKPFEIDALLDLVQKVLEE